MRLQRGDLVPLLRALAREFHQDDVLELAAAVAFRLLFALPALAIFFAALSSVARRYIGINVYGWLLTQLNGAPIPASVHDTIALVLDAVDKNGSPGVLSVGFFVALWSGSSGINTLIKAFNKAYGIQETRNVVRLRLMAIGLTLALSVLTLGAFALIVFGHAVGEWVADAAGLGQTFALVWSPIRWTAIVVLAMVALDVLYWAGPNIRHSFRWLSPGAVLATLLWLAAAWTFNLYLDVMNPGDIYGTLGAVVVLLLLLYVTGIVLLVGEEINAVLDRRFDREVIRQRAERPALADGAALAALALAVPPAREAVEGGHPTRRAPGLAVRSVRWVVHHPVVAAIAAWVAARLAAVVSGALRRRPPARTP